MACRPWPLQHHSSMWTSAQLQHLQCGARGPVDEGHRQGGPSHGALSEGFLRRMASTSMEADVITWNSCITATRR